MPIRGEYALILTCRTVDCVNRKVGTQFAGVGFVGAKRAARMSGWKFHMDDVLCPECTKKWIEQNGVHR